MRRNEKEITDKSEIEKVLLRAKVCRLAMVDGGEPYVVPLCFGYKEGAFYFHTAPEGHKIDILKKNSRVCFELESDVKIVKGKKACDWGVKFKSVIGWGAASLITDPEQKRRALDIIMAHYSGETGEGFSYPDEKLEKTAIIRVIVGRISGKKS